MVQCSVPGCAARGTKIFHSFPSDRRIREKWIEVTKTSHLAKDGFNGYAKVCKYHFRESDFVINSRGQRGLKPGSIPSLKLPVLDVAAEHNYAAVS